MEKKLLNFDIDKRWDYENGYYITSEPARIGKAIAQYELYRSIVSLPGQILEFGIFKGASFIRLAAYREILESQASRKLIGFDIFGKFPVPEDSADQAFVTNFVHAAGDGISQAQFETVLAYKNITNYELIAGDILQTLPEYVETRPELRIALLHIDVDVYNASQCILENLFDRVVPGGIVMLDDYASAEGETRAVDEFLAGTGYKVEKLPYAVTPAFIRK